ncbi:hypothetical protein IHE44_0006950 [Lamprotornis superbus]|uniref:Uncharacterized protein n=1 Tax=Lamprotornis superbus TaxID=245042 RepID=A0A835TXS5_9PASS|nr:hypothetical protein IHE44_0006950 [Lamprotornis superbus]
MYPEGSPLPQPTEPGTPPYMMTQQLPAFCEGTALCRFDISTSNVRIGGERAAPPGGDKDNPSHAWFL